MVQLEHAEAIVSGAEAAGRPVILQISENTVRYHGGLEPIGLATLAVARAARVPVAVHLDHAQSADLVHEAVRLGCCSVMFDASTLPYKENLRATREIAEYRHARDVWVEAELGEVGGKDGAHAPGVRTDPAEARDFVAATGVDALAVAVGSSHAMTTRDAVLDFALIAALRDAVAVPLVLHGSSGVADAELVRAVSALHDQGQRLDAPEPAVHAGRADVPGRASVGGGSAQVPRSGAGCRRGRGDTSPGGAARRARLSRRGQLDHRDTHGCHLRVRAPVPRAPTSFRA